MSMRELLRIEMNPAQVREACDQWARERASRDMPPADAAVILDAVGTATVIFRKRRAPRAKKSGLADGMPPIVATPLYGPHPPSATGVIGIELVHE